MEEFQGRQGDVFIDRIEALPDGIAPAALDAGRFILAYGEVTGHAHAITADERVKMFKAINTPDLWLVVAGATESNPVVVRHEEHGPINLTDGTYKVTRQVEYQPGELPRYVAD